MIKTIFAFKNFNIACTDKDDNQVTSEQRNLLIDMLKDMLKRKVISPSTVVCSEAADDREYGLTVREILNLPGIKVRRS